MDIINKIKEATRTALEQNHGILIAEKDILVNETKPEFEGDYTVVLFPFVKSLKKSPEVLGKDLGEIMLDRSSGLFSGFNVIKGFLNLTIADHYWKSFLHEHYQNRHFGQQAKNGLKVMIEYSSPNTNKPLHLGHLRNNFLGWSISEIFKTNGYETVKTCIANDRGIHICKSMIAWEKYANGATPQSTGIKGDHFVGDYYVRFNEEYKKQVDALMANGISKDEAEKEAPLMKAAQQMLVDWENGKPEVIALWKNMNGWVYDGFDETYKRIGSDFDKTYYESDTYLLGKKLVQFGLEKEVFFKKADGSVWIDLTAEGLDEKIVQRKDGTAVYITQDIGLAVKKYEEFKCDQSIYVVGDEQNYHFKVLKLICEKLKIPSAENIFHLSYGMVELPTGRMKTREGNVVDADDIVEEMVKEAEKKTREQGKTEGFSAAELEELYETIGLGGLKFFLLRVDPKKRMIFNTEESIDLHGFTATFIQYAYARIQSILRKEDLPANPAADMAELLPLEKRLIVDLEKYPSVIKQACLEMNPSVIALYTYNLAKNFNSFYAEHSIAKAETPDKKTLRLEIANLTAVTLKNAMALLGIKVPDRM